MPLPPEDIVPRHHAYRQSEPGRRSEPGVAAGQQVAFSWVIIWLAARYYPGFCEDLPTHLLEMCGEEKRKAELEKRRQPTDEN